MKRNLGILMLAVTLIFGLTACQKDEVTASNGNVYMGEITAIDNKEITVNVIGGGQFFGGGFGGGISNAQPPEGFDSKNMPEGFDPKNMPEEFDPKSMQGNFDAGNMLAGESMTIKVTGKTEISINQEKGNISDLQVGDFIQFVIENEKLIAINAGISQQFFSQPVKPQ